MSYIPPLPPKKIYTLKMSLLQKGARFGLLTKTVSKMSYTFSKQNKTKQKKKRLLEKNFLNKNIFYC